MAGSRHHEVPQFLMRGFGSRIPKKKGDATFVWVYRRNAEPFECTTGNVGVEGKFYQHSELNVDPEITEVEGPFANCLNDLRRRADGSRVADANFFEFAVHMTSRTKHFRDSIINSGGFLADSLLRYLSEHWREYFGRYYSKHPEVIRNELEKHLENIEGAFLEKVIARQLVNSLTPQQIVLMIEQMGDLTLSFQSARADLASQLNDIVKQAHIKSLVQNLISEPRVEHFQQFHWFVRQSSEKLILGDMCCLFQIDSKFKSLGGTKDNIERIYVPISSDCVIVANPTDELPNIVPVELNEASASVSRDYFVTNERSSEMSRLQSLLGTQSELLTEAELRQIMDEVIDDTL
jgi:hypothetical protein